MENFLYNVNELKRKRTHSIDEVMEYYTNIEITNSDEDHNTTEEIDYFVDLDEESLSKEYKKYRVTELREILKYYSITRNKMRKSEIVKKIIAFELNPENAALVQLRYNDL